MQSIKTAKSLFLITFIVISYELAQRESQSNVNIKSPYVAVTIAGTALIIASIVPIIIFKVRCEIYKKKN